VLTQVTTESGAVYVFDDMSMTFMRITSEGVPARDGDMKWTPFANVTKLEEGHPMEILWIDGENLMSRVTTAVMNIQTIPVSDEERDKGIEDEVLEEDINPMETETYSEE